MGCLPLAVATGAGAAARQVVGVGVIGGMLTAVFIGVFFIPSFFYLIAKLAGLDKKAARKLQAKEQGAPAPAKQDVYKRQRSACGRKRTRRTA